MTEVSIRNAILIWAFLVLGVTVIGYMSGLRILASLALGSLLGLIALTTFYPVTNFNSVVGPESETKVYFLIMVATLSFLLLYLCRKILQDRKGTYFVYG